MTTKRRSRGDMQSWNGFRFVRLPSLVGYQGGQRKGGRGWVGGVGTRLYQRAACLFPYPSGNPRAFFWVE